MLLSVLINEIAFAPPFLAARAACVTSVMFGVSFTITGIVATSITQLTIFSVTAGCDGKDCQLGDGSRYNSGDREADAEHYRCNAGGARGEERRSERNLVD